MTARPAPLVVLAAGGTGGHVFPAQALAAELAGRGVRLALITDRRGGAVGGPLGAVETYRIHAGGVAGKSVVARLRHTPELAWGTMQAHRLLKRLGPDAVVGFGGYASVPTMLAAILARLRTAIHEQNAVLGRANRLLARRVGRIATSFESAKGLPPAAAGRVTRTGMPVRPEVAAMRGRPYPPLAADGPVHLFVFGGSQGARVFSDVVPAAVGRLAESLRRRLSIVQQCRPETLDGTRGAYRALGVEADLSAFFDDAPERLAAAHLVIARAGASTVAESTAVGRPAILVPYPFAIDDHQTHNARSVESAGAGWLVPEPAFTPGALAARLDSLFAEPEMLERAAARARAAGRVDAARRLADLVFEMLPSNGERETPRRAA